MSKDTFISPYRLALEANVRPQMVYNYIRQGYIQATKNELGKWQVARDVADAWIAKRAAKQA